ncbi:MAG: 30S ribosomal protein S17 [Gammaproteobacteria bacterium]|nr:MAG: 30S ribosomal protein S17 [Gammaproteobacteria bacterium]RLA15738.1 MAG: 30S ribosomal protein S17 [Gammaproteobacteria bacterium]
MTERQATPRKARGIVVSAKMDKSISVVVERRLQHPLYKKYIRKSSRFHAHDESNLCNEGDIVEIEETRPVSKTKNWRLLRVVEKARS